MSALARSMRSFGAGDVRAAHHLVRVATVVVDRWTREGPSAPAEIDAQVASLFADAVESAREELAAVETRLTEEERERASILAGGGAG